VIWHTRKRRGGKKKKKEKEHRLDAAPYVRRFIPHPRPHKKEGKKRGIGCPPGGAAALALDATVQYQKKEEGKRSRTSLRHRLGYHTGYRVLAGAGRGEKRKKNRRQPYTTPRFACIRFANSGSAIADVPSSRPDTVEEERGEREKRGEGWPAASC